jgi:glycosyltransferase involved in cell wall biosynthesis
MGAQGSLKYLFPIIWVLTKIFRVEFHFFVVGGWIAEFIKNLPVHRFLLRRINGMYCETESIVRKLSDWYGYKHAYWFPNFRIYDFVPKIRLTREDPLKLVFMSRITKSKGYEIVFRMAEYIDRLLPTNSIIIDFYGPLNKNDKVDFLKGLSKFDFLKYKGILEPKEINITLAAYDAMLFPTNYPGEGLPGTILDSYISGIPVIASDWRYNAELILHGQTGFIFDLNKEEEFYKYILELYYDRDLLYKLKLNAYKKSKDFDYNTIWNILVLRSGLQVETCA